MPGKVAYRAMQAGDVDDAARLVARVFEAFVAPDYAQEGVAEFLRYADPVALARRAGRGHFALLATLDERIVGLIEVREHEHVALLFVDGPQQRKGIARALLERALDRCRARRPDLDELTVNSSPFAVRAYERLGFQRSSPELTVNGVRFVPMALDVRRAGVGEG